MKLAALYSGGKDSTYAVYLAKKTGHKISVLTTIISENPDSFMFHTSNIGITMMLAENMGLRLAMKKSFGEKEKEVEDIKIAVKDLEVDGIVCGAIESEYQRKRVEKVCKDLDLELVVPLWKKDQAQLLRDMIKDDFKIMITSVSAEGLDESWLGRIIDEECIKDLEKLNKKHGINIAGEGGEFCTIVLNCPLFNKELKITDSEKQWDGSAGKLIIKDGKFI